MERQEIDLTTPQPNGKMGEPTKSAWEKVNDMTAELYGLFSPCAISANGLKMSISGSTVTLSEGSAYIPGLGEMVSVNTPISKSISGVTNNSWYHMYLMQDSSGNSDFELVSTPPSSPYYGRARTKSADTSRRYIGSIRSGASGFLKFEHRNDSIIYLENTNAAPFLVLTGGASTTTASVDTSMVSPVTAYAVSLVALNAATNGAYTRLSNSNGPSAQTGYMSLVSPGGVSTLVMPIDSSQAYTYAFDSEPSPTGAAFHRVNGYYFER